MSFLDKNGLTKLWAKIKALTNKSLYHLGAYDSADGKTRQTNYLKVDGSNIKAISVEYAYYVKFSLSLNNCYAFNSLVASKFGAATNLNWDGTDKGWYVANSTGVLTLKAIGETVKTVAEWNAYFSQNPVYIQYKLATAYTEQVIENESILPLDSNMAQMIRQDVVDSLQLFSGFVNGYVNISTGEITDNNSHLRSNFIEVKPNTKYEIRGMQFVGNNIISFYTNTKTYIDRTSGEALNDRTIITPSNCYYMIISNVADLDSSQMETARNAKVMVSEQNPYPHSEYHASKHITDDEATLLKQEEEKCRNLANLTFASGNVGAYNGLVFSQNPITLKANETYTLSFYCENFVRNGVYLNESIFITGTNIVDGLYYDTQNSDGRTTYSNNILRKTFTCITDIVITSGSLLVKNAGTARTYNAKNGMLNEGSEAKPYSEWNGELVHKKELPHLYLHNLYVRVSGGMITTDVNINILVLTTRVQEITSYTQLPYSGYYIASGENGYGGIDINISTGRGSIYKNNSSNAFGTYTVLHDFIKQIM